MGVLEGLEAPGIQDLQAPLPEPLLGLPEDDLGGFGDVLGACLHGHHPELRAEHLHVVGEDVRLSLLRHGIPVKRRHHGFRRPGDLKQDRRDGTAENAADLVRLFSESNSRFLIEVPAESALAFEEILTNAEVPHAQVGKVTVSDRLVITGAEGKKLIDRPLKQLKAVWQKAFDLGGDYQ